MFAEAALREQMDIKIFVDTDADIRLMRRIRRDLEQRGRTFDSVRDQYYATVRPMHIEYVEPTKRWADLIVPEGGDNRVALDVLLGQLGRIAFGERNLRASRIDRAGRLAALEIAMRLRRVLERDSAGRSRSSPCRCVTIANSSSAISCATSRVARCVFERRPRDVERALRESVEQRDRRHRARRVAER